ncbi:Helix-turn-helix [Fibrobacter intestinalis]|uniref:Helix-turn-helix n=1 Tax=Fibrobacter intestinalis TaxID=28122 RepID=A0A1M6YTM8_9BACT|nr:MULTISPECIES: helix-turn-helix transcriptional regulator [Fibrobacter]MDD7299106.1 helix-turn-helix transcriptional regulator [Fibrobacter intestinalis]PBC67040.1 helix-turn-helix protein [Fibrobacter sp. UWS1]SHL21626.1 Helix-turn-helix [Fibrobacter intestinalis]
MLAVVNQPRTQGTEAASFRIEGKVPKFVVMFLESAFNKALKVEVSDDDDDVAVPFEQTEWYRDIKASMTAGDTVKADRGLRGWTQKVLAQKLGISVQNLSEIERDVRPVSRKMAAKLAEVFDTDPAAYFRFV